ncbi:MAG: YqgE/AlgH family protein [Clostridia bacterium]|nr:YqgE/AlgH family protein [Deltaproteobacteria bacterium]
MAIEVTLGAPTFLIAVPQLGDPNFNRGVVFILEHGDEGSMGLIINRPGTLDLAAFASTQSMTFRGNGSSQVFQGGPVQTDRAFILHASQHRGPETEDVMDSTRLSYSLESLKAIVDAPPEKLRIFLGYAGWGPGQLAKEVTAGAWLIAPATEELIFETPHDKIWDAALRAMGIDPALLMHSGAVH